MKHRLILCLLTVLGRTTSRDFKLMTEDSALENKLFLHGNSLHLKSWLEDAPGHAMKQSDINANVEPPEFLMTNRSWAGNYTFSCYSEGNLTWFVDIPRLSLTTDADYWNPKEQWILSVTLTIMDEVYHKEVSLLDMGTEPIIQWALGEGVVVPDVAASDWFYSVSPCAPDVVLAAVSYTNSSILFKLTYAVFLGNSTTNFILDTSQYFENSSSLLLYDIALTNHHVVVLTSHGLLVTQDMRLHDADHLHPTTHNLTWSAVPLSCQYIQSGKLKHRKNCLSRVHDSTLDVIDIVVDCQDGLTDRVDVLESAEPFTSWTVRVYSELPVNAVILDTAYNLHQHSHLTLVQVNDTVGVLGLSAGDIFYFEDIYVVNMEFEPKSNVLFAYGKQIWQSFDGGHYFHHLFNCPGSSVVKQMRFDYEGNQYVALLSDGKIFYSKLGSSRLVELVELDTVPGLPYTCLIDRLGHVYTVTLHSDQTAAQINITHNIQLATQTVERIFLPLLLSNSKVVLFEYSESAADSALSAADEGQRVTYSEGGVGIILEYSKFDLQPNFKSQITIAILEQLAVDSGSDRIKSPLSITWLGAEYKLELTDDSYPGWTAGDQGKILLVYFADVFIITSHISSSVVHAVSPLGLKQTWIVPGKQWIMLTDMGGASWQVGEDDCRNLFTSHQQTLMEIDLHDHIFLSVLQHVAAPLQADTIALPHISMSNHNLADISYAYQVIRDDNIHNVTLSVRKEDPTKGVFAVRVWNSAISLSCSRIGYIFTIYLTCPCRKHLVHIKDHPVTREEYLFGNPTVPEHPVLYNLPKNYRPPSKYGVDIPTSDNIYNADPSAPRPSNRFRISKESGQFKQCLNKTDRAACLCTEDMMISEDAAFSDCKERVFYALHPGVLYPKFFVEQPGHAAVLIGHQDNLMDISEINGREPEILRVSASDLLVAMSGESRLPQSSHWYTPDEIKIVMVRSGLHHYRAEIISGSSFCTLYAEFQVYVGQTPIAYPLHHIMRFGVAMIVGGVVFVVYLWYLSEHHRHLLRPQGSQCLDIQEINAYVQPKYRPGDYREKMLAK